MGLIEGTNLGSYEILGRLGSGAMGEVYRARDSKLKREVAIKVLPDALSHDADYVYRFQREAEVLASLNHPHIAAIYDLAESGSMRFLVLELVEGETLAERLARGPIPVEEALRIAAEIAAALGAAHEKGITHRDLKPANVKVAPDGAAKVLDFGLAKIRDAEEGSDSSHQPTTYTGSTRGMIIGTAPYMSPEQAKSKEVDRRADVWAFGCLLYEMLTAQRAFAGETPAEIISAVLRADPEWRSLPRETPEGIRRLLRRCLRKDREQRLHDMADAKIEIDDALDDPAPKAGSARAGRVSGFAWIAALLLVALLAVLWRGRPSTPNEELRLELTTPPTTDPVSFALSPDGRSVAYVASFEGRSRLWLREMNAAAGHVLAGTDNAAYPFWSPEGRSIGFFADGKLKRLDVKGTSVVDLANASIGRGGTWSRDGSIYFAPTTVSAIFKVDASGGTSTPVTSLESAKHISHRFPQLLPDERHLLYYVAGDAQDAEARGVWSSRLDGSDAHRLFDSDSAAFFSPPGHLLFVRQGTLFAYSFDPVKIELHGNPFVVAEQVLVDPSNNGAAVSCAPTGDIVYRTGPASTKRQFVWIDRSGKELQRLGSPDGATVWSPSISPDGKRLAVHRTVNGNVDIWIFDLTTEKYSRLTQDPGADVFAVWSPDGSRIMFDSNRKGAFDFYEKSASGEGPEKLVLTNDQTKGASDWSPDGKFLLYRGSDQKKTYDLWLLPMDGSGKPSIFVRTESEERDGQFSPDGNWIAYQSNESGHSEIYLQPFPGPGGKWPVSPDGGAQVRWRHDGKELFYIGLDGRLMSVKTRLGPGNPPDFEAPVALFNTRVGGAIQGIQRQQYVVSDDGLRFLMNTVVEETPAPLTIILNWKRKP